MNRRKLLLAAPALILTPSLLLPPKRALAGSLTLLGAGKPGGGGGVGVAPTLDLLQVGLGAGSGSTTISNIVNTQTANTNDVIVLFVWTENTSGQGASPIVSSVTDNTGGPLGWARRGSSPIISFQNTGFAAQDFMKGEIWYAPSAAAQSALAITVTLNASPDNAGYIAFGVTGCPNWNSNPWDANGSLPASASNLTAAVPTLGGVSTTAPGTLILQLAATAQSSAISALSVGTGFTLITGGHLAQAGSDRSIGAAQAKGVTSAQSSATEAFDLAGATWNGWLTIADALVGT